jgi:cupin 2 domain-containing protein
LLPPSDAPATGERFERLLTHRNLVVEQILSGPGAGSQASVQDQDEWVLVLAGQAEIEVQSERLTLGPGEWAFLPAGVPHSVLDTAAGTSWLAVHLHPGPAFPGQVG